MPENRVLELFGFSTRLSKGIRWQEVAREQFCPFTNSKCFKVRKSQPNISIGTCTVRYGRDNKDIIICPNRLLERKQVFTDCIHLLTLHEPGNEFHIIPEVSVPGGSIDYFLVSVKRAKVKDFVAIEFQTLDSTGTVWPERQRLLRKKGIKVPNKDVEIAKGFGMNWKMTAKTLLIQLHHKIQTFEHFNKHLVLIVQNYFFDYMYREFNFDHLQTARLGDPMHIHSYSLKGAGEIFQLELESRYSTDSAGIAACLGIQAETKVELEIIIAELEKRVSANTLLSLPISPPTQMPSK